MSAERSSSDDPRSMALCSSWISRLLPLELPPPPPPPPPHSNNILNLLPKNPPPPLLPFPLLRQQQQPDGGSQLVTGFGPFQLRSSTNLGHHPRSVADGTENLFQSRSRSRPGQPLIHESSSQRLYEQQPSSSSVRTVARRIGSAYHNRAGDPAASRNFSGLHAFHLNTVQHLHERQTPCFASEPDEPFSYWNLGRIKRTNFVSSVYPASAPIMTHSRKRNANTYGFRTSKFGKFEGED